MGWCHLERGDENCGRDGCKGCDRCGELALVHGAEPSLAHAKLVKPDHPGLSYSGYVHKRVDARAAVFDRVYHSSLRSSTSAAENPGARVSWRTDAQRVVAHVMYREPCNPQCPVSDQSRCYFGSACGCACRLKLFIDDVLQPDPMASNKETLKAGMLSVELMARQPKPRTHTYRLEMPWGAKIDFRGVSIQSDAAVPTLAAGADAELPRYVAWGDSITHGWCGTDSYPQLIAQWNGWEPCNMAIQGWSLGRGDAEAGHAIAEQANEHGLVTIMIGSNNVGGPGVTGSLTALLDAFRAVKPTVAVALVTPPFWDRTKPTEDVREQIRRAMRERRPADARLVLVEGRALIPPDYFIDPSNVHPNAQGMLELASNLNAELGFSPIGFKVSGCAAGGVTQLQLSGLTSGGAFVVFSATGQRGPPSEGVVLGRSQFAADAQHCGSRALTFAPQRALAGNANGHGGASAGLQDVDCARGDAVWQVLDIGSCQTSRRGSHDAPNGTVHTLRSLLPPMLSTWHRESPPPPPPPPPPHASPPSPAPPPPPLPPPLPPPSPSPPPPSPPVMMPTALSVPPRIAHSDGSVTQPATYEQAAVHTAASNEFAVSDVALAAPPQHSSMLVLIAPVLALVLLFYSIRYALSALGIRFALAVGPEPGPMKQLRRRVETTRKGRYTSVTVAEMD